MAGALYLVRHGQTSHNIGEERLRGWLDISLATPGIVAARKAARFLQQLEPTALFASDLSRALQTAKIMSVTLALSPQITRELRPWNVGRFAGQPVAWAGPQLEAYMNGRATEAPPDGEPFRVFFQRWRRELLRLLRLMRRTDSNIVAVTHARNLYALEKMLFGHDIPVKGSPHPGAIVKLSGASGEVVIQTVLEGTREDAGAS